MRNAINITLLGLSLIIVLTSCHKKNEPCPTEFQVYGEVLPYDSIYKVGDTISLQAKFNKNIYEQKTGKYYNMEKLNIESEFYLFRIDTINDGTDFGVFKYVDIVQSNEFQDYVQTFSSGGQMYFSNIIFNNDTFFHEMKFIPKKKGIYVITYGPFSLNNNMDFEGKCSNSDFFLYTRLNKEKNNNIDLLKQSPDEHFNTWILQKPEERFYRGRFAYKVVD